MSTYGSQNQFRRLPRVFVNRTTDSTSADWRELPEAQTPEFEHSTLAADPMGWLPLTHAT